LNPNLGRHENKKKIKNIKVKKYILEEVENGFNPPPPPPPWLPFGTIELPLSSSLYTI